MFSEQIFRITPQGQPGDYKTYAIRSPRNTHQKKVTCQVAECVAYTNGWVTRVDENTDLGKRQAEYIRHGCGRRFTETRDGGLTVFTFPPEQQCFGEHYVSLSREPQFVVLGGDWRGNPHRISPRVHSSFDSWANDFGEHQDMLNKAING